MCLKRLLLLVALLAFVGCSGAPTVELVDVQGTVTVGGQPLDGVRVVFSPDPDKGFTGQSSSAMTDSAGKYRLKHKTSTKAAEKFGAEIGWHRITVFDIKVEDSRDNPIPPRIAQKHMKPSMTGLDFEVKAGEATLTHDFEVQPR